MHPRLRDLPRTEVLGRSFPVAQRFLSRLLGLTGIEDPTEVPGLFIPRCRSVHTFGMRFPLQVIFLDDQGRPERIDELVNPGHIRWCSSACSVLEIPAGGEIYRRTES